MFVFVVVAVAGVWYQSLHQLATLEHLTLVRVQQPEYLSVPPGARVLDRVAKELGPAGLRTVPDTSPSSSFLLLDALRASLRPKGAVFWAAIPDAEHVLVIMRRPGVVAAAADEAMYVVSDAAEALLVSHVFPLCTDGLPRPSGIATVSRERQRGGLRQSNANASADLFVALAPTQELRRYFGDIKDLELVRFDVDVSKLKHALPFLRTTTLDMSEVFQIDGRAKGRLQTLVAADSLLVEVDNAAGTRIRRSARRLGKALLDSLFADRDTLALTNLFMHVSSTSMRLAAMSERRLKAANAKLHERMASASAVGDAGGLSVGRSEAQVLEQFEAASGDVGHEFRDVVELVPKANVPVFLTYRHGGVMRVLEPPVSGPTWQVDSIVLREGDRVRLQHQDRAEDENGDYIAVSMGYRHIVLVDARPLPELPSVLEVDRRASSPSRSLVLRGVSLPVAKHWRDGDTVILPQLGNELSVISGYDAVTGRGDLVLTTSRTTSRTRFPGPARASCITDPTLTSAAQCESLYDAFGHQKPGGRDVWDAPCEKNTDCPFFQKNQRYRNYRGGCQDGGYCEMPLGVKRVGFRKYEKSPKSFPLCYGCPVQYDDQRGCCDKQQTSSGGPDYAFELDSFERAAQGL